MGYKLLLHFYLNPRNDETHEKNIITINLRSIS